jgi:hypothetical protein
LHGEFINFLCILCRDPFVISISIHVQYAYLIVSILMPLLWLTIILFCMHNLTRTQFNSLHARVYEYWFQKYSFFVLHVVDIQLVIYCYLKRWAGDKHIFICLFHLTQSFTSSSLPYPHLPLYLNSSVLVSFT